MPAGALSHPHDSDTDEPGAHQLRAWLQQTRQWLDTTDRTDTAPTIGRDDTELRARHDQLIDILATAPDDVHTFINSLVAQQLDGDPISHELITALDQNTDRRRWILEHWPHIVEYAEVDHAMARDLSSIDPITVD